MLHGKNMAIMSDLNSNPAIFRVPGPVMDVFPCEGGWKWTGWRHDGYLSNGRLSTFGRNEVGISLFYNIVLTNSGSWNIFVGDVQKFLCASFPSFKSVYPHLPHDLRSLCTARKIPGPHLGLGQNSPRTNLSSSTLYFDHFELAFGLSDITHPPLLRPPMSHLL